MNILLENSATIKSDSEYADIIARPTVRKATPRDVETVTSSEDQDFLSKLMVLLNKNAATVKTVINFLDFIIKKKKMFRNQKHLFNQDA